MVANVEPKESKEAEKPEEIKIKFKKEDPTRKFYPKGTPVLTLTKNNIKVDINLEGEHRVFNGKGKMIISNREESRRRGNLNYYTKRKINKATGKPINFHRVREPNYRVSLPTQPVDMNNHDRHTLRAAQRALAKKLEWEKKQKELEKVS